MRDINILLREIVQRHTYNMVRLVHQTDITKLVFSPLMMLGVPYAVSKVTGEQSPHLKQAMISSTKNWLIGFPITHLFFLWARENRIIETGAIPLHRFLRETLLQLFFIDTWFYWAHRLLHTKPLYWLHREHHSFRPTTTMSYVAMSVPEYLSENVGYYIVGPLLWKKLGYTLSARSWAFSNALVAFWAAVFHNNSLSFSCKRVGLNGPREHALHHSHGLKNYNYSLMFLHWDWLMGTYNGNVPRSLRASRQAD